MPHSPISRRAGRVALAAAIASLSIAGPVAAQDLRSPDARSAEEGGFVAPAVVQDLRSPDARSAEQGGFVASAVVQDLRSPDARSAEQGGFVAPAVVQDLRSPDARDVSTSAPAVSGSAVPAPSITRIEADSGFDWGDAAIGAAGMLALALAAVGAVQLAAHRRGLAH